MTKRGRPGISYDQFVQVWESLLKEGRAGTNAAQEILGGNKNTIASFREQYEREKSSKELALLNSIELTDAVHKAIASIKVKEVDTLEKANAQLRSRIDDHIAALKEAENNLAAVKVDLDETKTNFDLERLSLERKLAAAQARIEDLETREKNLLARHDQLGEQYNQAKQEAAVAKKEVEMLRETAFKDKRK
jgi:chromosome segregation ATPase